MLKLKLQYFGYLMRIADSLEKTLMLGKIEGWKRRGRQRKRWLDGITDSMDIEFEQAPGDGEGQGSLASCSPWGHKESDTTLATEEQPFITKFGASSVAQSVKNLPAMQETACNSEDTGSIPRSERPTGEGNGNPLQYSCLGNSIDREPSK